METSVSIIIIISLANEFGEDSHRISELEKSLKSTYSFEE